MTEFDLALSAAAQSSFNSVIDDLVADRIASRLTAHDPTLWGPDAESEASIRLAWTDLGESSRPLISEIEALHTEFNSRGLTHVVLCGMGGSSLAPEVICATAGVDITVLDSSDPDQVRQALADRLETSIVVVSSKSGGTVETDSQKRAYEQALRDAGRDPADHLVIVTDPGSPLDESARADGYHVVNANPHVGGRYSALTAFGLVPSGLAGAPIAALLDEASSAADDLGADSPNNPAIRLGTLMGIAATTGVDKLVIADATGNGLGNWIEQLVAESTGKLGKGILPVVVPSADAPNFAPSTADSVLISIGGPLATEPASGFGGSVTAPPGAQLLLWECATAIAGRIIGIDPFNQPDVEYAKEAARGLLDGGGAHTEADFVDGNIAVYASDGLLPEGTATIADAIDELLLRVDPGHGYIAIQAYVNRHGSPEMPRTREKLALRTGRPTTFGWGPRFLHSTGQYHKGGPEQGAFLQITCDPELDLDIPGRPFTFGEFRDAQAVGDGHVLAEHGRPVLRLHATDLDVDLARIIEAMS